MADLLRIAETGEKITGKKCFSNGSHPSGPSLTSKADSWSKRFNSITLGEIYRGDVLTATFTPETEPSQPTSIQQRPENLTANPGSERVFQLGKSAGLGGNHDGYDALPSLYDSKR